MNKATAGVRLAVIAVMATITWASAPLSGAGKPAKRPNFVWLMSEDNSVHYLDLYVKTGASTPHISKLITEPVMGVRQRQSLGMASGADRLPLSGLSKLFLL